MTYIVLKAPLNSNQPTNQPYRQKHSDNFIHQVNWQHTRKE